MKNLTYQEWLAFIVWLSGHDEETVEQMLKDYLN